MASLGQEQTRAYREQGFLLVSGLIPPAVVDAGYQAALNSVGAQLTEPAAAALRACYTPEVLAAACLLGGGEISEYHGPGKPFPLHSLPRPGEWCWPRPHIDHAIREHGHHTFPPPFRVASMLFLSDVDRHGGGTVVWPGSHHKIGSAAAAEPERYALMADLNADLARLELGEPLEMTPRGGDVLFYHYLCAHAGSMNVTERPRLAMNHKW